MKVGVVDYGFGNLTSVTSALDFLGHEVLVALHPGQISSVDIVVVPGVGSFDSALARLEEQGFREDLSLRAADGHAVLGLCLGAQLLLTASDEGHKPGFEILSGRSIRFPKSVSRVPHQGWARVFSLDDEAKNLYDGEFYYFSHSYFIELEDQVDLVFFSQNSGFRFTAGFVREHVGGLQFHPERSGIHGVQNLGRILRKLKES